MILKVFSIVDLKADLYKTPFFMSSNGEAIRAFSDLANDDKSLLSRHPQDFKLYFIGTFDDSTGQLVSNEHPQPLGFASDFVAIKGVPVGVNNGGMQSHILD